LFIGGLAESHAPRAKAIIANQFGALRSGDRFFWQNEGFDASTALMISHKGPSSA